MKRPKSRILLIRRKYVVAVALALAVMAIFYIVNHPALVGVAARERALPIYSVQRDDQTLSLTFNAADVADIHTRRVVEILNAHNVRATFFVTGDWVRQNEDLARSLAESGHELQNLSNDHGLLRKMTAAEIRENLEACNAVIAAITGEPPTIFRAPYGAYDDNLVALARSLGLHTVQWSIDSGDWRGGSAETIARQVRTRAFPGGIVLLHSNLEQTVQALPEIIGTLQIAGYTLIPVSELVIQTAFTITMTGRQIPV